MSILSAIYIFFFIMFIYIFVKDLRNEIDYDKLGPTLFSPIFLYTLFFATGLKIIVGFFGIENVI